MAQGNTAAQFINQESDVKNLFQKYKGTLAGLVSALAIAAIFAFSFAPGIKQADAATTNYPPTTSVYAMPIFMPGTYSATTTPVKFAIPYAARLVGFSAAVGGSSGTVTIDLQAGGVSLLSSPISASTNVVEATISTAAVTDESVMTIVVTISGASPSVSSITAVPTFVR
jgi:hypothetical protein